MQIKKVTVTIFESVQENNKVEEIEREYVIPIKTLKIRQYKGVAKALGAVMEKVKDNEEIMEFLKVQLTDLKDELNKEENEDTEISDVLLGLKDRAMGNRLEVLRYLMKELPDEIINLVGLVTDVNEQLLDELSLPQMMQLINACLEVNDIEELVTAGRDFFTNLVEKFEKEAKDIQSQNHLQEITTKRN